MRIVVACLLIFVLAGCANMEVRQDLSNAEAEFPAPAAKTQLIRHIPTAAPFAYTHFCLRYPTECLVHEAELDYALLHWSELAEVNDEVNTSIVPNVHKSRVGFDSWRIAPPSGDCNDFVVTKRHELLARGWPSRSLLLAEVVMPRGEHHLVLVVRSESEDVVLDNLTTAIRDWSETPYTWVRMQSPDDPATWFTVSGA